MSYLNKIINQLYLKLLKLKLLYPSTTKYKLFHMHVKQV